MKKSEFVVEEWSQMSRNQRFLHGFRGWFPGAAALLAMSLCAGTPCFAEENPVVPVKAKMREQYVSLSPEKRARTGVAMFRELVDSNGRIHQRKFLNAEGKPCFDHNGVAGYEIEYNEQGLRIRTAYLGLDGKSLILSREGVAETRSRYDSRGCPVQCLFFGVDGQPCYDAVQGAAGWIADYDDRRQQIRLAYVDKDGKSLLMTREGVADYRNSYDEKGRLVRKAFFDTAGRPCLAINGVAGWKVDYNERGQQVRVANLAPDGKSLMMSREGIAVIQNTFDSRGYLVRCRFFGVDFVGPILVVGVDGDELPTWIQRPWGCYCMVW